MHAIHVVQIINLKSVGFKVNSIAKLKLFEWNFILNLISVMEYFCWYFSKTISVMIFKLDFLPKTKKNPLHFRFNKQFNNLLAHETISIFSLPLFIFDTDLFWICFWIKWNLFIAIRLEIIILISLCQNRQEKNVLHSIYKHALDTILICKTVE